MKTIIFAFAVLFSLLLHAGEPAAGQLYVAKAIFEYVGQVPPDAEKTFTDNLPRGEQSTTVHQISNTPAFAVSVSAASPEAAATRANQIVLSFRELLSNPNAATKSVRILNPAKASEATPQTN